MSDLRCPFCDGELEQSVIFGIKGCHKCRCVGTLALWESLSITIKALDWIANNHLADNEIRVKQLRKVAKDALKSVLG